MRPGRIWMTALAGVALVGTMLLGGHALRRNHVLRKTGSGVESGGRFLDASAAAACLRAEPRGYRKVHVYVALYDNLHQGIAPVPAGVGNGQDPAGNLYWGARYGIKTQLARSRDWRLLTVTSTPFPHILERAIFRHRTHKVCLVADAYDGAFIKEAIGDTLQAAAGRQTEAVSIERHRYLFGGGADLVAFIGHDGLMEFALDAPPEHADARKRDAIILCCISDYYFTPLLRRAGAYPLLTTTQFMCPEAYTLEAALAGWTAGETPAQIHARAARAYSRYQRCSARAAGKLLKTGY